MKYKKNVLENGLTVITVPMPDSFSATALVLVETGSKYETKEKNGISHFLEHMCFKGTKKRPHAIDISKELDGVGAQYNAFTSQEYTGYWAKANYRKLAKIFDVVSDIYLNPVFDEREIEKEKGVIVEEINMYEDAPARHIQDIFMTLLYGDQPAGWNIAGEKKTVVKFTKEDFMSYRALHYVPRATTVVIAGRFNEKEVMSMVQKRFAKTPAGHKGTKPRVMEKQSSPQVLVEYKKTDQTHLVLGVRSYGITHKKSATLSVMASILGGGMSSRLFQKLREEMGVGYYVRATNDAYTDHGVFQVSAGVDTKRVFEVVEAVLGELRRLRDDLVPADELQKVKDHMEGGIYLGLEGSDSRAEFYGSQEILKHKTETPSEIIAKLRAVSAQDVRRVARDIFKDNILNLAVIGPFKDKKPFERALKF